jgi:hypothetical protein
MAMKHKGKVVVSVSPLIVLAWEYGWCCTGWAWLASGPAGRTRACDGEGRSPYEALGQGRRYHVPLSLAGQLPLDSAGGKVWRPTSLAGAIPLEHPQYRLGLQFRWERLGDRDGHLVGGKLGAGSSFGASGQAKAATT